MLVHLLSAGEPPSPRNDQRGVEAKKSVGQEVVGPQRPLPRDPGLRGPYADRLVPVRRPGGAPSDRCTTYLPQSRPASRGQEVVEDHVLLRRSEVSRARCCEVRPACCARFDREQRRRCRGSVPCGFTEDGSRAGVALVRDAADVPQGRLPRRRTPRDKRRSHAENDCTSTRKETLIADLQYSASRAGRSAGRSLSWHGRGRGFKSHPVHTYNGSKLLSPGSSLQPPCPGRAKGSGEGSLTIQTSNDGTTTSLAVLARPRTTTSESSVGSSQRTTRPLKPS